MPFISTRPSSPHFDADSANVQPQHHSSVYEHAIDFTREEAKRQALDPNYLSDFDQELRANEPVYRDLVERSDRRLSYWRPPLSPLAGAMVTVVSLFGAAAAGYGLIHAGTRPSSPAAPAPAPPSGSAAVGPKASVLEGVAAGSQLPGMSHYAAAMPARVNVFGSVKVAGPAWDECGSDASQNLAQYHGEAKAREYLTSGEAGMFDFRATLLPKFLNFYWSKYFAAREISARPDTGEFDAELHALAERAVVDQMRVCNVTRTREDVMSTLLANRLDEVSAFPFNVFESFLQGLSASENPSPIIAFNTALNEAKTNAQAARQGQALPATPPAPPEQQPPTSTQRSKNELDRIVVAMLGVQAVGLAMAGGLMMLVMQTSGVGALAAIKAKIAGMMALATPILHFDALTTAAPGYADLIKLQTEPELRTQLSKLADRAEEMAGRDVTNLDVQSRMNLGQHLMGLKDSVAQAKFRLRIGGRSLTPELFVNLQNSIQRNSRFILEGEKVFFETGKQLAQFRVEVNVLNDKMTLVVNRLKELGVTV